MTDVEAYACVIDGFTTNVKSVHVPCCQCCQDYSLKKEASAMTLIKRKNPALAFREWLPPAGAWCCA